MATIFDEIKTITDKLETARDELRVKAHLAKADAATEWEKLESDWQDFQVRLQKLEHETESAREEIMASLRSLGQQLQQRYENIRQVVSGGSGRE